MAGVAGSGAAAGSFGASGACFAGFWWVGRCAQRCGKSSKPAPDTHGGEFVWFGGFFPGQSLVGDQGSGEPELGVGGGDRARSTSRPGRGCIVVGWSTRGCSCRTGRCVRCRSGASRLASTCRGRSGPGRQPTATASFWCVRWVWVGVSTSTRMTVAATIGGASWWVSSSASGELGMQAAPGLDVHGAVAAVLGV